MKKNLMTRIFKGALALLLAFSVVETSAFTKVSALDVVPNSKVADTDTSEEWRNHFINNTPTAGTISTGNAGYVWSDKTVLTSPNAVLSAEGVQLTDDSNFLVELSAISANREVVGYSTIPTDTMLVLDLSNSMTRDNMFAMVKAVNAAMDKLLKLNNENRVGIAVYDTDASVLLPLDRYTTTSINNNGTNYNTSDDYPQYIQLVDFNRSNDGANTGTIKTIYSGINWTEIETSLNNASNKNRDDLLKDYFEQYLSWNQSINWQDLRDDKPYNETWTTYLKSELPKRGVTLPVDECLVKDGEGNDAKYSVAIGGGTYMQAGMWHAWKQFESITDTVVPDGILAGTKRMPVMVLMTDGAPTFNTVYYNNVNSNSYDSGNGQAASANNRNGFITQLTASWSKEKMAAHYNNTALFYTLGLGVGDNEIAQSILNPDVSTDTIDGYWSSYLAANNDATIRIYEGKNYLDIKRDTTVKSQDYVNKYFGANDADGLINAFNEIVSEIILQSKYYPTLAESKNYNMDGFMSFTDQIGEYMEVKEIKGLISGTGATRKLYSGSAFAKAFIRDNIFGNISTGNMNNLDDDGKDMIKVIQNRLGCTEDQAKEALRQAILQGHVSYTSDTNYSNYMCWFADANGKFVAVWNGEEDATFAGAKYRVTDYGFYGTVGSDATFNLTDMAYIVVQVLEDITTGQQTMIWKVPASLIPVIEYEVSFDGNSYENATNIKMNIVEAEPLRLIYEVGVQSDITEYNISEIVDPNYEFINSDKNYTFYTNLFNYDEVDKKTGADSDKATEMLFEPSYENERYYYTQDTYVLNSNVEKVKEISSGQTYAYEVVHFNKKADGSVDLLRWHSTIETAQLENAVADEDGYLYLPKDTPFTRLAASGTTEKYASNGIAKNITESLGYFNYPILYTPNDEEYSSKTYLGNNGRVTIEPKTGIKLSKVIENVAANTNTSFDFVIDLKDETGVAITKELEVARFHKDGTAYDVYEVTPSNGKITVTLLEGEYAYVMDLPEGAVYTVTEKYNEDYSLKIATVNGLTQSLNAPYDATGTTKNNVFDNVVFENALTVEGTLTVEKEVEYAFDVNAQVAANKEFTILVDLGAKYAGRNIELVGGKTVAANANGVVQVVLKDGESVTFVLDEGDGYVVTETNLPAGFTMNTTSSVNLSGSVTKDGITATVVNTYAPGKVNPVNMTVEGNKTLTGREWLATDEFQYVLQSFDGSQWNTIAVVDGDKDKVNSEDKTFNFNNTVAAIEFAEVGTYYYRVVEVNAGKTINGVTYDSTVYNFDVVVADADLDGKLEIADVVSTNATITKENDSFGVVVSFANTYAPSGNAEIKLNINKEITNNTSETIGKDGYTFELYDDNGRLVATSNATTTDGVTSIELVFSVDSLGEHEYVLKEVVPASPLLGMVYDTTEHEIIIKVFDNLDGTLKTEVKVDENNFIVSDSAEINFNNIYDEETHVITGNKELIGREWQEGDAFSFELYVTDANFENGQLVDTQVVNFASATKEFAFDAITYYEPGSHYYVIKEVTGNIDAIRYDEQEYHVTVTLTRDANTQLIKEVTIVNANGETVNNITFTNEYLIEATVKKVWNDAENQDGIRPDSLTVTLSNGTKVTLSENNKWTATVKDLPVYDADGNKIAYTWTEENVAGYKLTNTSVNGTLTTLTNTHTPEETTATVVKVWNDKDNQDGKRPAELKVTLSDGTEVTLKESNGWTATVGDLPKYANGVEIEYRWTENSLPEGYTLTNTSVNGTITTLTNTYVVPVDVEFGGNKVLTGREWQNGDSFSFELYATDANFENAQLVDTKVVDFASATKSFTFDEISYETAGTYYFVIKEVHGGERISGVTYDAQEYHVTVTVTADENGQLDKEVVMVNGNGASVSTATFTNTYEASDVTAEAIVGTKTMVDMDMFAGDFKFDLYQTGSDYSIVGLTPIQTKTNAIGESNEVTDFAFDAITYETAGTYYYVVTEQNGGNTIEGITYDDRAYKVNVVVVDNLDGTMTATVNYVDGPVAFRNTYKVNPTSFTLGVKKEFTGREWTKDDVFAFELYETTESYEVAVNATPMQTIEATNVKRTPSFESIEITSQGTRYFVIKEVHGGERINGVNYSSEVYRVRINAMDNGDGTLAVSYSLVNSDGVSVPNVIFVNTYKADEVNIPLGGYKTMHGRDMSADEFTFELYMADENGNPYDDYPYDTVTNIAGLDGVATKFEFTSTASYTKPTKAYVLIVEKAGNLGGVTYDSREYVVEITVTDNLEGKLVAEITSIVDKNGKQYDAVYFDNYYKAAGTTAAPIVGNKTMYGRDMNAGEFTFNLYQTDENYSIEGLTPVQTTTNVAGAKEETTNFAFNAIPYETAGTYYYVVTETKGTAGGVTYDERTYRVNIEVVDNLDGTMTATVNYVDGTVAFRNSYDAKDTNIILDGFKTMHGRDADAEEFEFELYYVIYHNGIVISKTLLETVKNVAALEDVATSFKFSKIGITRPGTMYFEIVEKAGNPNIGVTYDSKKYLVEVTTTDNLDGQLVAAVTSIVDEDGKSYDKVHFHNYYSPAETQLTINGNKTLNGRDMKAEEFAFNLYQTDENYSIDGLKPIQTTTNVAGANGEETGFSFTNIPFETAGTYYFVVTEENGGNTIKGVTYDSSKYEIKVEVEDNLDGTMTAKVVAVNGSATNKVSFTNTYKADKGTNVTFEAQKELSGREWKDGDAFTFELYATGEDYKVVAGATPIQTITVNDKEAHKFEAIPYSEVGTHYYVVKESHAGETINGITYSTNEYQIKVVVVDNLDGTLTANYTYENNGKTVARPSFENTYKADSVSTSLSGSKVLNGRDMSANEFTFNLYETDETFVIPANAVAYDTVKNEASANGVADEFEFKSMTFDEVGTYYYTVVEEQTAIAGVTMDTTKYNVTIKVVDDTNGKLVVDEVLVNGKANNSIAFVNTYTIDPTAFEFGGNKTLNGRDLAANEFTFNLYESDVTFTNRNFVTSVKNDATGAFEFTGLEKAVGTYYYVVEEEQGTVGGVTYDNTHYHVIVKVVDNGVGGTSATVEKITKLTTNNEGTVAKDTDVITFVNKYVPVDEDGLVIGGNKVLTGRHTIDGEFTFELYEANSNYVVAEGAEPIRTVNEADTFEFEEVYFDKTGDYYFVVKELDKNAGGMDYDSASFNVHVNVTDDGKGQLHAAIVSINGSENGTITFKNTYTIEDEEELVISGTKEFTGRDWTEDDVFTFELYETNDKYELSGAELLETKTATKGNVNFSFSKFVYKAEETHYYVVKEVAGASDNGITYDTKQYQIEVVVTDNHDGTLSMTSKTVVAGTEVRNIKFINTYEVFDNSAAYADIEATKTLSGRPLKNAEFTFELYEATYDEATGTYTKGEVVETVKNANTAVKFNRIKYTEVGTYHYIVKEQAGNSNVGITYDTNEYPVTVVVYDDGNGRLAVDMTVNGEVGSITINNTYTVTPDTFELSGTKELTGRDLVAGEFEFSLYKATDSSYADRTLVTSVKNDAAGKFEFAGLSEQAGTYYYVIEEKQGSKGGVTYDASHYHVVVTIVDNGLGTTEVSSIAYTKVAEENGKVSTEETSAVTFKNTYTPTDSVGLVLGGNKALAGRHTIDGEFTFELYKTAADFELVEGVAPIQTVNEDDKFEFKPLTYPTTGTHYYVIKELDKNAGGMTYDTASYRITVEVTDDLNGELVAEVVSMTDANGKAVEEVTFNNSYEIKEPVKVLVNGNKVLRGREWLDTDVFTFELYEANSNYVVADGAQPLDTQTATKGNTAFAFDEFTYNAEATHYYVVKEVVGTLGGVAYDTTVFNVKVVVTDNHDGTLSVEKTYFVGNSKVNEIEFVNTYEVLDSSKAYATIRGIKYLEGRALANNEFEFELYEATYDEEIQDYVAGELVETVKNTATAFTFSTMEYSEVGTHYYVVKEKAGELGGITYDETIYVIEVNITDGYDGKLYSDVAILNSDATVVEFNNTYTIYPDTFSFEAVKTLTGREMNAGEFSFELYETNSSYEDAKLVQTVKNDKDGKVEFTGLSKYPGTYYYVIKEVEGTKGGVSYDSSYYQVKIVIVDEGNGTTLIDSTTITKVSINENGAYSEVVENVEFNNTYTPTDSDGIVIEGTKELTGRHMINGEFAFELYDGEGTLKQTVVNKDGKFAFSPVFFEEVGTYTYTVKEKDLAAGGMSYDATEFVVVIKVADDLNGELVATIASINGSANTAIKFQNTYEIKEPNSTIIKGFKTFTGREWTENDVFTFELYEANSDYEVAEDAKPLDTQTATKGNTAFTFKEIEYNAEATHYYVVKEVAGDASVGITYDASVYNVKVDVVDLHDGTLSVAQTVSKANTVVEEIEFVNTYKVYEGAYAQATISGIKTLTTRPIKDAEFTFDLYETGSDFVIVEGSTPIQTVNDGVTFTFETIKYEMIGTYYYVVKEMNAGQTINGVTYDEREHKVQVDVTDGGKGYLVSKVTVIGKEDNTLVVDNKYTITPTEFSLDVNKVLTGRDMNAGEFTFELFESDATFANTTFVMSTTNNAEGKATFEGLAKLPGTYYYVISEKVGSKGGVTYDAAKYQVTVTVADDELGGTVVTNTSYVKVTADGAEKAENVEFNNTYEPKDTEGLVVAGIKVLTGRPLVNGEFVFELFNETGELLLQTTVNKDGRFEFAPLTYEEVGTHVYTIKEKDNGIGGITYDPTVFKVTVVVEDDLNGELVAKVSEIKVSGSKVDAMIFENTYKAEPIKNVINGIKVLTGRDWLASDAFTFELYETESDFVISTDAIDSATATKDNQEFAFNEITYDEQGEYYYVVKEVAGTIGGVAYDVRLYNVKVTVTDMLDGTFTLEQEVVVDDEVADMIEFVNPYSAKETGLTLFAQKEMNGRDLVEKEFVFELYEANAEFVVNGAAIQAKENAIDGKVVFDELTFAEVGTYYYVITEKAGTASGVTYDDTKYFVTITVTDDLAGNLVAEIASITTNKSEEAVQDVTFNNTYTPAQTVDGIVLTAKKIFNGRQLADGQFTFNLFETDESYKVDAVALQTAKNDAIGNVTFAEMNYDKAGTYYYVITEEIGNEENIIYDTARYMVEVKVTDDKQGQLHAEVVSITKEGVVVDEVVFENTYFVNTADTTTANGYLVTMFASALALIVAISKKRKLSK